MVANRPTEPASKCRTINEWPSTVALSAGASAPSLDKYYRAIDALAEHKDITEAHRYSELCNVANLDLRLVRYDLTSSYFETVTVGKRAFPSPAFGDSRDHRGDRPQVMIGLLVTSDGIPIAHYLFAANNTADVSTRPGVMEDLKQRFGVGKIALVTDRGAHLRGQPRRCRRARLRPRVGHAPSPRRRRDSRVGAGEHAYHVLRSGARDAQLVYRGHP